MQPTAETKFCRSNKRIFRSENGNVTHTHTMGITAETFLYVRHVSATCLLMCLNLMGSVRSTYELQCRI